MNENEKIDAHSPEPSPRDHQDSRHTHDPGLSHKRWGIAAILILVAAITLTISQPLRFFDGDEWSLFFITRNFSQGIFSIDSDELFRQRTEARSLASIYGDEMGGLGLGSYRQRPDGRYVLEKSPGYFLFLGLFRKINLERWMNVLMAAGMVLVLIWWSRIFIPEHRIDDMIWLILFTPASLIMLYRPYMESFTSYALLTMGGLVYLIADKESVEQGTDNRGSRQYILWTVAGLLLGAAVFVRTAILPTVLVFGIHFLYRLFRAWKTGQFGREIVHGVLISAGIIAFLAVLLIYNTHVNGSPLTPGYALGKPKQSVYCFSFQRLFSAEPLRPWAIIVRNIIRMPELLVNGYPLLFLGIPGIALAFRRFRRDHAWLLVAWFASIFLLYLQFLVFNARHFMVIGRLYLPAVTPLAIFSVLTLGHLGGWSRRAALILLVFMGLVSYFYFLCIIHIDPFNMGILDTFDLKNWISYK